jgi:ATP synthase F1 gamma subunit
MPSINDLKAELEDVQTLKFISSAFTEASSARIKKIRDAFEKNVQFYEEIMHLSFLVQQAGDKLEKMDKKLHKGTECSGMLFAAVTSNQRFYGNINISIMRRFVEDANLAHPELLVVGNTGSDYLKSIRFGQAYERMAFAHDYPSEDEAHAFLERIKQYKTVILYYPRFKSLMTQEVGTLDITQHTDPSNAVVEDELEIIFEPEVGKMIDFFEHQVRGILFFRVMLESDLSRTAARLMTMSAAEQRSTDMEKEKKGALRKQINSKLNAMLLETFAGRAKWKK